DRAAEQPSAADLGDARDLPSFPARRSSDLHGGLSDARRARADAAPQHLPDPDRAGRAAQGRLAYPGICRAQRPLRGARHGGDARSEEHTSELQSRENLVCRLLLEKKKKTKT